MQLQPQKLLSFSIALFLTSFLLSCAENEQEKLSCVIAHNKSKGVDFESITDSLATIFIHHGIITSNSPSSYEDFFQKLEHNPYGFADFEEGIKSELSRVNYSNVSFKCNDKVGHYQNSVWDNLQVIQNAVGALFFMNLSDSIEVDTLTTKIISEMDHIDFNHRIYQSKLLTTLAYWYGQPGTFSVSKDEIENGRRRLPPPLIAKKKENNEIGINAIKVFTNSKDEVYFNDSLVSISSLVRLTKNYILNIAEQDTIEIALLGKQVVSKAVIYLENENGTSYDTYIQVQNQLTEAYHQLRNDAALNYFGEPYDQLLMKKETGMGKEKIKALRSLYPQRIREYEP